MKFKKTITILVLSFAGLLVFALVVACFVYPPQYVFRVLAWQESDAFDWQKFPSHPLTAAPAPFALTEAPDPRAASLLADLSDADNWEEFLAANQTQAFLVIQDGTVRYENYFNGTEQDSIVTSFSMAKSFTSALIGIAIDEGLIHSVDDPITLYLPELAERDSRFAEITIRHLLLMSSGLDYKEFRAFLLNGDDPLTTYYPDQRKIALENTRIIASPGLTFNYNKYHPQLLGMILERAAGMTVTEYLQTRVWDKVGMEYDASWSTDSRASDFEKMETGVNARARDFARFGMLFLNDGAWQGEQVISKAWVRESTRPLLPGNYDTYYNDYLKTMPGRGYYTYMWWGCEREDGSYDFFAAGDKGQFIYISPQNNLVIVRNGIDFGISTQEWIRLFYEFASQY